MQKKFQEARQNGDGEIGILKICDKILFEEKLPPKY